MGFPSSAEICLCRKLMQIACELYSKQLWEKDNRPALNYLRGRGYTDKILKAFSIGYAPKEPLIRRRVCSDINEGEATRRSGWPAKQV